MEISDNQSPQIDETIFERLKPHESSAYDPTGGCLPGTRSSVLRELEQWSMCLDHSSRVFWLYGVAGCGKSTVANSLASALDSQNLLSGSYFCTRDSPQQSDAIQLIRALAYHLGRAIPPLGISLVQAFKDDPGVLDKSPSSHFKMLLADRITGISQTALKNPIIFVLDALDACNDRNYIASLLLQMARLAPWLTLIITTRPFQGIQNQLESTQRQTRSIDLFSRDASDDIRIYVLAQLESGGHLFVLRNNISEEQVQILVKKSFGLFIWITTVCRYVGIQASGKSESLGRILESDTTPDAEEQLDILYLEVLKSGASEGGIGINKDTVRLLVSLVYATSKHMNLPASGLHAFVPAESDIPLKVFETLVADMRSVLIADVRSRAIQACHPSFLGFLGDRNRSRDFWTEPTELDTMMTKRCFSIMMSSLKFNICELETSYLPNVQVKDLKGRIKQRISRELQYSCLYWLDHLAGCKGAYSPDSSLWKMPHELLCRPTCMYWIEVLSLLSELREAVSILHGLMDMLKNSDEAIRLQEAAVDLYRFVRAFQEPMSISTPHIYISALLWVPSDSMIAQMIRYHFTTTRCVTEGLNKRWPAHLQTFSLPSSVYCIAYSPDGRYIVSGCGDKNIQIWETRTGVAVGEVLRGHEGPVRCISYSPDGLQIASGSEDGTLRFWNARTGVPVGEPLRRHEAPVISLAYSPDGINIVSASEWSIRLWNVKTCTQILEILQKDAPVLCVAYLSDNHHFVSGSLDGSVRVWDARTEGFPGEPLWNQKGSVSCIAGSPNGRHIAHGFSDATIRIQDAQTGREVCEPLKGHTSFITCLAYSPDGRYIVSGSIDETVRTWDTETYTAVGDALRGHNGIVNSVAFSPKGRHAVSGSMDRTIRIWAVDTDTEADEIVPGHTASVECVTYSPDGLQIASASSDKTVRLWDAQTFEPIKAFEGHIRNVYGLSFSPDGRYLASGSSDETLRVWDIESATQVGCSIRVPKKAGIMNTRINGLAYSPNGRNIVFGACDKTARFYNTEVNEFVEGPILRHEDWVQSVAYSPDGKYVVTGSNDGTIGIWKAEDGSSLCGPFVGHKGRLRSVAYSPDGRYVISGSDDRTVCKWDAQTGKHVGKPLAGHMGIVQAVAYSPDGRFIASGSDDRTVRVWNAESGEQVGRPLRGHNSFVFCVAWSPDGKHIISGSADFSIRVWDSQESTRASPLFAVYSTLPDKIPVDGWIRTSDNGLLLWVPPEYRDGMFDVSLARMPRNAPGHPVRVDWDSLPHGSTWTRVKQEQVDVK